MRFFIFFSNKRIWWRLIVCKPLIKQIMKQLVLISAIFYGANSVILGAFGAHALKKVLSEAALRSFETGVRYQMFHAIVLLIVGFYFSFSTKLENAMAWMFIVGTFLFSVSIYILSMTEFLNIKLRFLGPVTPLGGLFMITGWILLGFIVSKGSF